MYCPNCGQERTSQDSSFCSRCGFLLTGAAELLNTGGVLPVVPLKAAGSSPRSRGVKQGLFIFLLTFLVVPLVAITSIFLHLGPFLTAVSAILLFVGGLLKMAHAGLLESPIPDRDFPSLAAQPGIAIRPATIPQTSVPASLPPQQSEPAAYSAPGMGKWRDTNELETSGITERTTNLLTRKD